MITHSGAVLCVNRTEASRETYENMVGKTVMIRKMRYENGMLNVHFDVSVSAEILWEDGDFVKWRELSGVDKGSIHICKVKDFRWLYIIEEEDG